MTSQGSNRNHKEIIIRKSSSRKNLNRPTSQGGSGTNATNMAAQETAALMNKRVVGAANVAGVEKAYPINESSLLNNSLYAPGSGVVSPTNMINLQNQNQRAQFKQKIQTNQLIHTQSTNVNSDGIVGATMPHKQQQFWKGDAINEQAMREATQNQ
jgi:hypothetical protein